MDWDMIQLPNRELQHLEEEFTEEEVTAVVQQLASEKAPGPDGFIGIFYKTCWEIIKGDVLAAINYFFSRHDQHFNLLDTAHIVLLPKKEDASMVGDFRPISLCHSFTKLISKVLAIRLSAELDNLVSRAQSAFIRKRSIHDTFLYTQNLIRELHKAGKPTLFLKLDIAKAFDTVRWDYLQEVLQQMGFGARWRAWVSILLGKSSSTVLLNGKRGKWFKHKLGLRQGDPLSPMLFILAMEPLQLMLNKATEQGLLTPIANRNARIRISLFADDAAIFLNPVGGEVQVVKNILAAFGSASGLITNTEKSAVYPIRCEGLDLQHIMEAFQCPVGSFPCKYLGLPLNIKAIRRVDIHPLIDKVGGKLAAWKGRLLSKAGRLRLVNSVLSSIPTYFLTVFKLPKWAARKIDKLRRSFLWKGDTEANGGHCLVQWAKTLRPKKFGGLGILDLDLFGRALRLRWLWFQWTAPERPWVGTQPPVDAIDRQLFRASTVVTLGNGEKASFWQSTWMNGQAPMDRFPDLFRLAWRKNKTVKEEIQNQNWTRGLWRMQSVSEMASFVQLWDMVQEVQLNDEQDSIFWRWTSDGVYTTKSAYNAQFLGTYSLFKGQHIWQAEAEEKHKFFAWLLVQCKILTVDKMIARQWPCNPVCTMCNQEPETTAHLILHCIFSRQVWDKMESWTQRLVQVPVQGLQVMDW